MQGIWMSLIVLKYRVIGRHSLANSLLTTWIFQRLGSTSQELNNESLYWAENLEFRDPWINNVRSYGFSKTIALSARSSVHQLNQRIFIFQKRVALRQSRVKTLQKFQFIAQNVIAQNICTFVLSSSFPFRITLKTSYMLYLEVKINSGSFGSR